MKAAFVFLLLTSFLALGDEAPPGFAGKAFPRPTKFQVSGKAGLSISAPSTGSGNRIPLLIGVGGDYYFGRFVGGFLELHATTRGFRNGANTADTLFLDWVFGVTFKTGGRWFAEDSTNLFRLGGYFAQGIGNYTGSLTLPFPSGVKNFMGIYYSQDTLFPVTESLKLGFSIWGKLGLSSASQNTVDTKFYEAGIGLAAAFR